MCAVTPLVMHELIRLKIVEGTSRDVLVGQELTHRLANWPSQDFQDNECMTIGLPDRICRNDSFENHLFWWPQGVPDRELMGVVSSRLDRKLEVWRGWFCGLRCLCAHSNVDRERLLVAEGTTTGKYLQHAARLFGKPTLQLRCGEAGTVSDWLRDVRQQRFEADSPENEANSARDATQARVYVSPGIVDDDSKSPLRDRLVADIAKQVTALHVSNQGITRQVLLARLNHVSHSPGATRLLLSDTTSKKATEELLENGCVGWYLASSAGGVTSEVVNRSVLSMNETTKAVRPFVRASSKPSQLDDCEHGEWLTHCTRRRVGPWPNQPSSEYLDELLFEEPTAERSAIAALQQIVGQRRLISSSDGVRGNVGVVCFTAVPVNELSRLNVFRPHRGRWDFQPYGVSVARRWLEQHRARSVRYASPVDWEQMSPSDRPFFQMDRSTTTSRNEIDWTVEEEWRVVGDVDLSRIPSHDCVVFVPTPPDAERIRKLTHWRIVVLDELSESP